MNVNEELARGLKKDKIGFSLVWIAPIIALIITSGMIYKTYRDAGTYITIIVDTGDGIKDRKTPIMYKGIKIGVVEDIHIHAEDVSKLELIALIDKEAAESVTREGNMFWMVKPKVSLTEVSGLDTIITGIYIAVMPAKNTKEELYALPYQDTFTALDSPPVNVFDPGLAIRVNTVNKGDIAIGAPVLYNKQAIGKVEDKRLSSDRLSIDLFLRIDSQYADLIHEDSIFYKTDALEVKASLSSVKINMGSFASFIAGGIAVYNSDEACVSPLAKDYKMFSLFDNYDQIMLSEEDVVLTMDKHNNLTADITKVFYKGVEAGLVKNIEYDPKSDKTKVSVRLHNDFRSFANKKAYFWVVSPKLGFDRIEGLDSVVRGNYINFISRDIKAKVQNSFILHDTKPQKEGVPLKLLADNIKSIKEGAGVFYHDIEIGVVDSYKLNKDKKTFTITIIVQTKYKKLLNESSRFYHNSGVSFKASLSKVAISAGSMETILRGGIAVETSDFKTSKKIKKRYKLYKDQEDMIRAEYLMADGIYLTLLASSAGSLKKGSAILYKQLKVGEILSMDWDSKKQNFILNIFIIEKFAKEVHANTLFYNASGIRAKMDLNGLNIDTESIETIVTGGIAFFTPAGFELSPAKEHAHYPLYETKDEAISSYFHINLVADNSMGLKVGSAIKYKNVSIGEVQDIDLVAEDVSLKIRIDSKYKELINAETIFWTEGFSFGLGGVENASAALSGPSIVLRPGESKLCKDEFSLLAKPPVPHYKEEGLRLILDAARLGGLKPKAPVYFRQIKIGSVVNYELKDDATGVNVEIFIEPCYAHLIRKNSYFFNTSGIGMDVSLFGAKVKTETLESIISGGVGVLTPDDYEQVAKDADVFKLNESFDEDALRWKPKLFSQEEHGK